LRLPTNQNVLLTDTVGFIASCRIVRRAFKATLEEVVQATCCCHVGWTSAHPLAGEQIGGQRRPGGYQAPRQTDPDGLQQIDRLENGEVVGRFLEQYPNSVASPPRRAKDFQPLSAELGSRLRPSREFVEIERAAHRAGRDCPLVRGRQVSSAIYNGDGARFKAASRRISTPIRAVHRAGSKGG